jgi:hypothetical protein
MIGIICWLILKVLYTSKGFWDSYTTIRISSNKNQLDALFILIWFHQSTSTCFRHICSPSSGGILYIYNNWYMLCFLVDCLLALLKHVEIDWQNKLRINSASSWFLLHKYSEMHGQQNIKFRISRFLSFDYHPTCKNGKRKLSRICIFSCFQAKVMWTFVVQCLEPVRRTFPWTGWTSCSL